MQKYEKCYVAIDAVIFTIADDELKVLLKKREKDPAIGEFELYGGLLRPNETADDTLKRKLKEVQKGEVFFEQFKTFTSPKRDPRTRVVSIAFIALMGEELMSQKEWFSINHLPDLAFDHKDLHPNDIFTRVEATFKNGSNHVMDSHPVRERQRATLKKVSNTS